MAPRAKIASPDDNMDRSYESSPDPLAASITENKITSRRKAARASQGPLLSSSPSKQNRRSSVSEFEFTSPSKSMVMDTPRVGGASPWRIKVTVQAEQGSEDENLESPTVKRVTRTRTTTVPLKDVDGPSPVKRRGRPRKSDAGTPVKPKRKGTPVRRRSKSAQRDSSIGLADASAADVDTDAAPKKRRGRPRKSIVPVVVDESPVVGEPELEQTQESLLETAVLPVTHSKAGAIDVQGNTPTPGHDTQLLAPTLQSTAASPVDSAMMSTQRESLFDQNSLLLPTGRPKRRENRDWDFVVQTTPQKMELAEKVRARKGTPHAKVAAVIEISSDEEENEGPPTPTSSGDDDVPVPPEIYAQQEELVHTQAQSLHENIPTPPLQVVSNLHQQAMDRAQTTDSNEDDDGDDGGFQDVTNFAFDEGATRMPDDSTILESENFSMISIDSLPSSGGLSSPPKPDEHNIPTQSLGSVLETDYLHIHHDVHELRNSSHRPAKSSPLPSRNVQSSKNVKSSPQVKPKRYITPAVELRAPSNPPAIAPAKVLTPKSETPSLGRVVKAGVALQGLLDPDRLTPNNGKSAIDERRDRLDDLFRGFSEGTRRELQAGLRLGEQLAHQRQSNGQSSPIPSSPIKERPLPRPANDILNLQRKQRQSRLLTPEEQEGYVLPSPPRVAQQENVQYPSLKSHSGETQLLSPTSGDEMSWRYDTPPIRSAGMVGRIPMIPTNNTGEETHQTKTTAETDATVQAPEDYSDIWQEEASRNSDSPDTQGPSADGSPQLQDLFANNGPVRPPRGKLPTTWRRKSSNNFQYSDEAEESQPPTPSSTQTSQPASADMSKGKEKAAEIDNVEHFAEPEEDASDASDDTGMFFQSNLPNIFNKKRSTELRKKKAEKFDLSLLMNEGQSMLPESSPPVIVAKNATTAKQNPFQATPPRFPGFMLSPSKSSPLRQELRGSDISSSSLQPNMDESSLPLPQSSPFHTQVEGDTVLTTASDQRQFRVEMEGVTDSSIRRLRTEADGYLDAYEAQQRTLDEIQEVTEHSKTWNKDVSVVPSSPPQVRQAFERSILSPRRSYAPLFGDEGLSSKPVPSVSSAPLKSLASQKPENSSTQEIEEMHLTQPTQPIIPPARQSAGLFGRFAASLLGVTVRVQPPPQHPVLSKSNIYPLPKVEPWTKTHYRTLDHLYSIHKRRSAMFSCSETAPNSVVNKALLADFLQKNKRSFVGAEYSAWGYNLIITEELVVLSAAYIQLLTLNDVSEYETMSGKDIQMGDCNPGVAGDPITGEEVVKRLATIIMGESVRKDEKKGIFIDRSKTLVIQWPN